MFNVCDEIQCDVKTEKVAMAIFLYLRKDIERHLLVENP